MARSLVQALEGIAFPCDRSRLIEYARTHEAAPKAVDTLIALPEGEYRTMSDVMAAIPSKEQMRRRTVVTVRQTLRQAEQPAERQAEARAEPSPPQADKDTTADLVSEYVRFWQRVFFPWLR